MSLAVGMDTDGLSRYLQPLFGGSTYSLRLFKTKLIIDYSLVYGGLQIDYSSVQARLIIAPARKIPLQTLDRKWKIFTMLISKKDRKKLMKINDQISRLSFPIVVHMQQCHMPHSRHICSKKQVYELWQLYVHISNLNVSIFADLLDHLWALTSRICLWARMCRLWNTNLASKGAQGQTNKPYVTSTTCNNRKCISSIARLYLHHENVHTTHKTKRRFTKYYIDCNPSQCHYKMAEIAQILHTIIH